MAAEWLGIDEFCERIDKDRRTVMGWIDVGLPHRKRSNKLEFPWLRCLAWWEKSIREDERASRHAGGDLETRKQLADARVRSALAAAEEAEIALARSRGETIPVDFMTAEFRRIGGRIRTKLLQLPASWAAQLGTCTTFTDRRLVLLAAVNQLMPELQALVGEDVAPIAETELSGEPTATT